MRFLISIIAAALAAVASTVRWILRAGKWILDPSSRTASGPDLGAQAAALAAQSIDEMPMAPRSDLAPLKRLAGAMAGGVVRPGDFEGVDARRVEWLRAMDRSMLYAVSMSTDERLAAHIAGRRSIRGVLAADADSIAAYVERSRQDEARARFAAAVRSMHAA